MVQAVLPSGHSARPAAGVAPPSGVADADGVGTGEAVGVGVAPPSSPGAGVDAGRRRRGGRGRRAGDLLHALGVARELDDREHDGDQREREQHADDRERGAPAARLGDPGADGGAALQAPLLLGAQAGVAARAAPLDRGRRRRRLDAAHWRCSEATGSPRSVVGVVRRSRGLLGSPLVLARVLRQRALVLVGGLLGAGPAPRPRRPARPRRARARRSRGRRSRASMPSSARRRARSVSGVPQCEHQPASEPCSSPQAGQVPPMPGWRTTVRGRAGQRRARPRGRAAPRRSRRGAAALRSMMSLWLPRGAPAARWTS